MALRTDEWTDGWKDRQTRNHRTLPQGGGPIRGFKKALYILISDLSGKLYLSFFITAISLVIFEMALSTYFLRFSFPSRMTPRCFQKGARSTSTLLSFIFGWIWTCFFFENDTSWAGYLGSGLKGIFQLKAYLETDCYEVVV